MTLLSCEGHVKNMDLVDLLLIITFSFAPSMLHPLSSCEEASFLVLLSLLAWGVSRENNGEGKQVAGPADEMEVVPIRGTGLIRPLVSALHWNSWGQLSVTHNQ